MTQATETRAPLAESTAPGERHLRTLVVCDLADSTALVERLGDHKAALLLRRHDRLARTLIEAHDGREVDKTDGFLLLFKRPIQAVAFALDYQRSLHRMSASEGVDLRARIGIHVGDVTTWRNSATDIARGAKPMEVEGLVKPVAARLAALARPGQILLSDVAATIARRSRAELTASDPSTRWTSHGRYRVKGVAETIQVHEVGSDAAPFHAPHAPAVAHKLQPWWRRRITLASAAVVLLAAIATAAVLSLHQPPTLAFAARDWVVVGDLQNKSGDTGFDAAVDTAMRIGLKQSHYVNVISDMQVRQTLGRMGRPADINVDRKVGSEVALRENAKALILPSIANRGKGIRIKAELIDPTTGQTIATVSATADEQVNVVATVDAVVRKLRNLLGESVAQIQSSSIPLAKATTSNLEALRAFSLSGNARGRGDIRLSLNLLHQALKLDPDFALAYAAVAADYISLDQHGPAQQAIEKALEHDKRLSYMERLVLNAQKTIVDGTIQQRIEAWKVVANLYPDSAAGAQNTAMMLAAYMNDCEGALPYSRHAVQLPQPSRAASQYLTASCELSLGQTDAAIRDFKAAIADGFHGPFVALADAYIATRRYDEAAAYLNTVPTSDITIIVLALRRALISADQGDLQSAEKDLRNALQVVPAQIGARDGWRLKLDLVGILWGQGKKTAALANAQRDLRELLAMDTQQQGHLATSYPILVAAYSRWAARLGDLRLARRGIVAVTAKGELEDYPIRRQLIAITNAEMAIRRHDPEQAIQATNDVSAHPLWELLEVAARAKVLANTPDAATAVKIALDSRSLAFGELWENNLGICTRIVQWNALRLEATSKSAASEK